MAIDWGSFHVELVGFNFESHSLGGKKCMNGGFEDLLSQIEIP